MAGAGAHGTEYYPEEPPRPVPVRRKRSILPPQEVELAVQARNLPDRDVFSKSDPMCVLLTRHSKEDDWTEIGRTETIHDCLNPSFVTKFQLPFFFEGRLYLRFELYDVDSKSSRLSEHDPLGCVECTLSNVVQCSPFTRELQSLHGKKSSGTLQVIAEHTTDSKEELQMQWCGNNLDRKDLLGSSDPFLEFSREYPDGSFSVVYRTEVISRNINPVWKPFSISKQQLCNNDEKRVIKVTCFDWNRSGKHSYIGEFRTTVETMKHGCGSCNEYELINPTKQGRISGKIILKQMSRSEHVSFFKFINSGRELQIVVGVDFSLSNKDPADPSSLHYTGEGQESLYSDALAAVLDVLQDYNTSCNTLAYGFGARVPGEKQVKDAFALDFAGHDSQFRSVQEVLDAYHRCVQTVARGDLELSGPTNFAPLINSVTKSAARQGLSCDAYHVLLMLTDGELTDMSATREAIIEAAQLPISIVVIGIGDDQDGFEALRQLDVGPIREGRKICCRDIVQFVEFGKSERATQALLQEVLREIPIQVSEFLRGKQLDNNVERKLSNRMSSTVL